MIKFYSSMRELENDFFSTYTFKLKRISFQIHLRTSQLQILNVIISISPVNAVTSAQALLSNIYIIFIYTHTHTQILFIIIIKCNPNGIIIFLCNSNRPIQPIPLNSPYTTKRKIKNNENTFILYHEHSLSSSSQ